MLHERMWLLRVVWIVPLVAALSFGGCAAVEGAVIAIACAAAVLMGIKDARVHAECAGMRFAFDDLRERNLGLLSERELDTRTQGVQGASGMQAQDAQARTAGPFCNLTEREYAVAKLVAEGMDNRRYRGESLLVRGHGAQLHQLDSWQARAEQSHANRHHVLQGIAGQMDRPFVLFRFRQEQQWGFLEAVQKKIDERQAKWDAQGPSDFDAWDKAEIEYLEGIRDELERGVEPKAVYERLKAELPELEERVAGEEACYTFDWYDDHHYEKIYSGRLMACRALLELYER